MLHFLFEIAQRLKLIIIKRNPRMKMNLEFVADLERDSNSIDYT